MFTWKDLRIVESLDGRKARNTELYKHVHEKLQEARIHRTIDQIKRVETNTSRLDHFI